MNIIIFFILLIIILISLILNNFYSFSMKKNFQIIMVFIIIIINAQCVTQTSEIKTKANKQIDELNYNSVIETLSARLVDRFKPKESILEKSLPIVYISDNNLQKGKISLLNMMLINDLTKSLQNEGFTINNHNFFTDNKKDVYPKECINRFNYLNWDIRILISNTTFSNDCTRLILSIEHQNKQFSETCHLSLTPDLKDKNNNFKYIPKSAGNIKKPFKNVQKASEYIVDNMNCMITKLLPQIKNYRLIIAKTDNTISDIFETLKKQWANRIGTERLAQTLIPIDLYADQFIFLDKTIINLIPKDIKLIVTLDSMEIRPGKFRIRSRLISLTSLKPKLINNPTINFGKCIPGCKFDIYTHTKSKGKTLVAEGSGVCLKKDLPQELWSYSAKTNAEKDAKKQLFNKIKTILRKDYITKNTIYNDRDIDKSVQRIMKNSVLEWESFDEESCKAYSRYIIYASSLPFEIPEDKDEYVKKDILKPETVIADNSKPITKAGNITKTTLDDTLLKTKLDDDTLLKTTLDDDNLLIEELNKVIQNKLIDDQINPKIVKRITIEGFIQRKECISILGQTRLPTQKVRCLYNYDLTFFYDNQKLCLCKGFANSFAENMSSYKEGIISTIVDLLYPFPLDISMALSDKISQEELLKVITNLDNKYFQLFSDIDSFIQLIETFKNEL